MCLIISKNADVQRDEDGNYIGYKVLFKEEYDDITFLTPWRRAIWSFGKYGSSRTTAELSGYEDDFGEVHEGIHLYADENEAISAACKGDGSYYGFFYVFKVTVAPEDFVAAGTFGTSRSFVATKVTCHEEDRENFVYGTSTKV